MSGVQIPQGPLVHTMTKKERQKIESIVQYLKDEQDFNRVKKIRQVVGINSHYNEEDEINTILNLYDCVLKDRTKYKADTIIAGTSGWNIRYIRDKKKYRKGEDFKIDLHHTFVDYCDD